MPGLAIDSLQIFRGYEAEDLALFNEFTNPDTSAEQGFIVDFLGSRTRVASLYDQVQPFDGRVLGLPIPGDYHAEAVEWLGVLKTVKAAKNSYCAMEWGAGWAPWLIAGAVAARRKGISDLRLYGVEADPIHFDAMRQHFIDNDLPPGKHVLLRAAVGAVAGSARWPNEPDARNAWGTRPVRSGQGAERDEDYLNGRVDKFIEVEILAAKALLQKEAEWDMLHIDIQGWEGEVCRSCMHTITQRVKWVIIGVHSRILDAELLQLFHDAGWVLEHEKPTRFRYARGKETFEAMVIADGTQVWRNPTFIP